jgi:hypothetical protein
MRTDPGVAAAYEANKKLEHDRLVNSNKSTTKAVEDLTSQISDIREAIAEVRDMLKTLVGIYSIQNRGASAEFKLRKSYEQEFDV